MLENKIAIVPGGSRGIGGAIAKNKSLLHQLVDL